MLLDFANVYVVSLSRLSEQWQSEKKNIEQMKLVSLNQMEVNSLHPISSSLFLCYLGAIVIDARRGSNAAGANRFPLYISQSSVVC